MVAAAATRCDYAEAVRFGEQGLAAREALTAMNETFTTYQRREPRPGAGPGGMPEDGPAWWPGDFSGGGSARACGTPSTSGRAGTSTANESGWRPSSSNWPPPPAGPAGLREPSSPGADL